MIGVVRDTIRRHAMLAGGERVLVGVSGGADSVGLLLVLRALAGEFGLTLFALHVDHGLRPGAEADAGFVQSLGDRWEVPVAVARVVVPATGSLEASARAVRYRALRREAARLGADRIAVGHTADDQAETVLMRLLEGAGPRGLAGIAPRRGPLIRPLLEVRHAAVLVELTRAGVAWREDASNRDPRFLRNRVRHELIPYLRQHYNPAIVDALVRVGRLLGPRVGEVEALAARALAAAVTEGSGEILVSRARLRELPEEVAVEVIRLAAARLGADLPRRAWAQRGLRRLLRPAPPAGRLPLGPLVVEASGQHLRLAWAPAPGVITRALAVPGLTLLAEVGRAIEARLLDAGRAYTLPSGPARVAFDADALPPGLAVRARQGGDGFVPFGETRRRRLKSFLIAAGVPRWQRDGVPLIAAGDEILWVAGLRRARPAPVTPATRRVLELSLVPLAGDRAAGSP